LRRQEKEPVVKILFPILGETSVSVVVSLTDELLLAMPFFLKVGWLYAGGLIRL